MKTFTLMLILIFSTSLGESANILGIFPLNVKSHYVVFETLLKALAEKGHHVDVVTHFPSREVPPRYNQLSLKGTLPDLINNLPVTEIGAFSTHEIIDFITILVGVDVCKATMGTPVLRSLRDSQKKYDLVITEIFGSDCMLGFGHLFKAPIVSMTSSVSLPWENDRIGNPDNPAYIPNYFHPAMAKMSLYERIENTVILVAAKFLYRLYSTHDSNKISKEFFGSNLPSLEELARNTSLILVNSHFSINHVRPTVPNFVEVGGIHIREPKPLPQDFQNLVKTGGIHIREPKPLPQDFQNLVKTDAEGIIYLTMGSMILTETFEYDKLQGMFDAFAELPYKVLWKASREKFPKGLKIPKNIHFAEWMPQIDLLCNSNVKLFVSHGGLLGTQEAIYCGVPVLGIPLFADQDQNILSSERMGLAVKVAYENIKKETILTAAKKLLEDPSYKQNSVRAAQQFKDRPMSPLDTAVYWVEYVIRNHGAPHLRSVGADLPWYQYHLLDVIVIFISVLLVFTYLLSMLLKLAIKLIFRRAKQKFD